MFRFKCAHCGKVELFHHKDRDYYLRNGRWPDREYGEEIDALNVNDMFIHQRGYRYALLNCPGFKENSKVTKEEKVSAAMDWPSLIHYLDEATTQEVERRLQDARERALSKDSYYGGCTTYIFPLRNGGSRAYIGE